MQKWNYKTNEYEPYSVPEDWYCPLCEDMDENNMGKKVNCANCGKEMRFSDVCESKEIQTLRGSEYGVCKECHDKEWPRTEITITRSEDHDRCNR